MKQTWNHVNEAQLSTLTQGYLSTGPFVVQGIGANQRVGNDINIMGLHLKGALHNNSAGQTFVRAIVVGYNASNGDPTINLFRNTATGATAAVTAVNGLDCMYFPINKLDLHVYWDKVFRFSSIEAGNAGQNTRMFNKFIKLGGRKVQFKATGIGPGYQNWQYSVIWISADASDDTTTGTSVDLSYLEIMHYKDA